MPLEFHRDPEDGESVEMYVDDIPIPGVYRAQEIGGGITEQHKAEIEHQSGGQDEADAPPAARIEVEAYIEEETFEQLNALRDSQEPFEVQIGPFAYTEMGIRSMEAITRAEETNSTQLNLTLQEFREVIIQERNLFDQGGGSGSGLENMDAEGPGAAWVDEDGDGRDDNTGEPIPEMETVPMSPGQEWTHNVGTDEAWGRVLIDSSAGNSYPQVIADGSNWSIQDVGFRGMLSDEQGHSVFGIYNRGGKSIIRNVYIGDGAPMYSGDTGATAMWVAPETVGQVTFDHIHVAGWPDNGIYASAPKGNANILIKDSYGYNNGHANFRLGKGMIKNSVSLLDGGGHSANGPRAVWARTPGPVEIRDSDLIATGESDWNAIVAHAHDGPSTVNVENSGIEGVVDDTVGTVNIVSERQADPQNFVSTIPGNAVDAAAGVGSSPDGGSQ